ncbi:MAG: trehalose-phosphatase [Acidimicrobiia bacterium]|nr:trehalose-phosphatase [Acidimicrobiia bacterium]
MITKELVDAFRRVAGVPRLLVACDYDGTLSPIVDDPSTAIPHAPAVVALVELAELKDVGAAIVSGRSLRTLATFVKTPPSVVLIGDHGAWPSVVDSEAGQMVAAISEALSAVAADFDGAVVEPKSLGAAFHYRHVSDKDQASAAARAVATRFGARVIEGKQVVELVLGEGDKGAAIRRLQLRESYDCIVFFGDDVTDEDVFAVLGDDDVGVKVGDGPTLARYRVADPVEVAQSLEILVAERRAITR